jgi:O-antigen ligase
MEVLLWGGVALTAPLNGVRISLLVAVSDVLLVAALVTSLPDVLRSPRRGVVPPALPIAFCIVIAAGIGGTFVAQDAGASLSNMAKVVLAAGGSVVAIALWDPGPRRLRQFAWLWFTGALVSAAIGLVTPRPVVGRALGLTTHPNHLGLVCVLAVGLGVGLAFSSTGWPRLLAIAGSALLITGVGISGSRSALLGLAVTIVVAAILTRRLRLLLAAGVAGLLAGMAVVVGLVHIPGSHALSRLGGGGGSADSDIARHQTLAIAIDTIDRHPLTGEGFQFAQAAHSIYVQALVVGGPVALGGFLWGCWAIGRAGLRGARAGDERGNSLVVAGLTAGFAGYLASGTFDNILWDRYLWLYLGLLLVLAGTLRLEAGTPDRRSRTPERAPAAAA